jgi:synaptobrevin family protein YKT6
MLPWTEVINLAWKVEPELKMGLEESNPRYIYAYGREGGICATMITSDDKYGGDETRLAISLLRKISDEFLTKYSASAIKQATTANSLPFPELAAYIIKYQKPTEADAIGRIQKELDETKVVLHQTIESMLERGEKIDNLVSKSENLSQASKMFYTQVCSALLKT